MQRNEERCNDVASIKVLRYIKNRNVRSLGKKKGLPRNGNEKYMAAKSGSRASDTSRG